MPTVHLYLRAQVTMPAADADRFVALVTTVQTAVEQAGGTWRGSVSVVPEAGEAPPAPAVRPAPQTRPPVKRPATRRAKKR